MAVEDKLISNTSYLSLNWFFNTVMMMLFWIILGKTLPPYFYGVVAFALQISTLLSGISLMGMGRTLNKLIPEFFKNKDNDKISYLIKFSMKTSLIMCLFFSIIIFILSGFLHNALDIPIYAIYLTIPLMIFITFSNLLGNIHFGFQNMKKFFLTNLYGWVSMIVLGLFFVVYLKLNYIGAIFVVIISYAITFFARIEKRFFSIPKNNINIDIISKYSRPALVIVLVMMLFNNSQYIILSFFQNMEVIGLFAVALKISSVIFVIPGIFSNALFPIVSELSVDHNSKNKQSYLVSLVLRYSLFIIIPVIIFTLVFSESIILFFSSPQYLGSITLLPILVISGAFFGIAHQFLMTLYATGNPKKCERIYVTSVVFYIISSIILTSQYSSIGLATSYLLSTSIILVWSYTLISGHLNIKSSFNTFFKIFSGSILAFLPLLFLRKYISNIGLIIIGSFGALLLYLYILLKLDFYNREDIRILDFLSSKIELLKPLIEKLNRIILTE